MQIELIDLDFVELPLKAPFETSMGRESVKSAWLVTLWAEGIPGYAECVADAHPFYTEETHATVYYAWKNDLVPRLAAQPIGDPETVSTRWTGVRGHRMAKAALEMAVWDWFGRARGIPLWRLLGGDPGRRQIPVGVSIGIQPSLEALKDLAIQYQAEGYQRIKIKIKPGWDVLPVKTLREALGASMPMMADANSAYRPDDAEDLARLDDFRLMMLEQPLAYDDLVDHQQLARRLRTPICLDESIRSAEDARRAFQMGACSVINIKPGRVGGYQEAKRIHDIAMERGYGVWCGGMLETGIGRAHNLHLSTLPNFRWPGDTSASDRYFVEDLVDPPFQLNPDGTLSVPEGPGIGVYPDPDRLRRFRRYHETWRGQTLRISGGIPDDLFRGRGVQR
ncbi:mandelate racemase/muconate lactonizing protein [Sulfobacillus acidophilus TPY]|uniref:o-succinylbenzoate synthase n=1 Tax=Sulfobacillus acidophilus (strain ATCC 700253 / DSM 10332 / NAL) TaxID=679936 RepID=G8U0L6_SULAD|nr:mandelate racemase/muconate lactonizing protein [Sulfobacillus acidophilus TPY]AEW04238.1 O-succinylbenzoate synthase [Sulfobacillus acidophilus DSM 10332]